MRHMHQSFTRTTWNLSETTTCGLSLLDPKLIHLGKGCGVLRLEHMPIVEINGSSVFRKTLQITASMGGLKSQKFEASFRQERSYLRDGKLMLLDVKEQIPAFAGAEEISKLGHRLLLVVVG